MYKVFIKKSKITGIKSYVGETIEAKVRRIVNNKEPIKDGAPLIYTDRKDGVLPGYNIRTDRFDVAVEAMDKVTKSKLAKRAEAPVIPIKDVAEGKPLQGTDGEPAKSI